MLIKVEISPGELCDKLTILSIKAAAMTDDAKLANVVKEASLLQAHLDRITDTLDDGQGLALRTLCGKLHDINVKIWDIEDGVRDKERQKIFDDEFIELARSVYLNNDQRATFKRQINELLNSAIIEEKSYAAY